MPHIFFRFQNRVSKVDFDSPAVTAEKAKFLIAHKIGTSDVLELTLERDGTKVKERQILESGTTVRVQRTANKSFRQSMRDIGGTQHRKRLRNAPNTGDTVIGISNLKPDQQLGSILYSGQPKDTSSLHDDEFAAMHGLGAVPDSEAEEERKFRILQESVRSTTRSDLFTQMAGRMPLNAKATLGAQRKNAARSAETSFVDPPPANYVCHACGYAGHWIYDCDIVKNRVQDGAQNISKPMEQSGLATESHAKESKQKSFLDQDSKKDSTKQHLEMLLTRMQFWSPEEIAEANRKALEAESWSD